MDWLRRLLEPDSRPARTSRLATTHARDVAALHRQGGFARSWEPGECAALIAQDAVIADGVFAGGPHPAGFVMSRRAADEAEILSIVVDRDRRGAGLGRILLAHHLARLAAGRATRVFLDVADGNLPAERLYRHFGFREVGRRQGYYPLGDGRRVAAITMRLDLE